MEGSEPSVAPGQRTITWSAAAAALAVGLVYLVVSEQLVLGQRWLPVTGIVLLTVLLIVADRQGQYDVARRLWFLLTILMTAIVLLSTFVLLVTLPRDSAAPRKLLLDATLVWLANVLAFASWYWELDGGGPA